MKTSTIAKLLLPCLLLASSLLSAKNIQYVSDDLTIPMRTGTTMNHKILKFLNSGMALEVLEETEDKKYLKVALLEDDTKVGWVEAALVMSTPSARERLQAEKKRNQSIKEKHATLKKELSEMKQQNADLQSVQSQLEDKVQDLQDTLARLRASAAQPIRIADENQQLKLQLQSERVKNEKLIEENAFLSDDNIKQWFMIGAAVSLGSLILGLLITRINWKKKDSWAGSF